MNFAGAIKCSFDKWTSQFEEPVAVYCTKDDAVRVELRGHVRATVIVGSSQSAGAGASIHPETADRVSVVIRCMEWWSAFTFVPRFGMQFDHCRLGRLTVKQVQRGEFDFTCRCTLNQRASA